MKILKGKSQSYRDEKIYQISTLVAGGLSLRDVLGKLARIAVELTDTQACSIRLLDDETGELKMSATFGLSDEYRNKGPVSKEDPVIKAAFGGEAVIVDDMGTDIRVKYPQAAKAEGIKSQFTVSMVYKDKPLGVLRLYSSSTKHFRESDEPIIRLIASQCAIAITNAKYYSKAVRGAQMAQQMRLAGIVQRRMIPQRPPVIPGLDVAAVYQPCFNVGGDYYDFFKVSDNVLAVAIADVIGKGIPAAIMTSSFRGMLRAYSDGGHSRHGMQEIIEKLNRHACSECRDGEFITFFYALIDTARMTITYCNCGHEPALMFRSGKVKELDAGGLVLGILQNSPYEVATVKLKDGDSILFYTDGLIDAINFEGKRWGIDRLLETAKKTSAGTAEHMVHNILRYQRRFTGLAQQVDDTSIIVAKVDRTADPKFLQKPEQ